MGAPERVLEKSVCQPAGQWAADLSGKWPLWAVTDLGQWVADLCRRGQTSVGIGQETWGSGWQTSVGGGRSLWAADLGLWRRSVGRGRPGAVCTCARGRNGPGKVSRPQCTRSRHAWLCAAVRSWSAHATLPLCLLFSHMAL